MEVKLQYLIPAQRDFTASNGPVFCEALLLRPNTRYPFSLRVAAGNLLGDNTKRQPLRRNFFQQLDKILDTGQILFLYFIWLDLALSFFRHGGQSRMVGTVACSNQSRMLCYFPAPSPGIFGKESSPPVSKLRRFAMWLLPHCFFPLKKNGLPYLPRDGTTATSSLPRKNTGLSTFFQDHLQAKPYAYYRCVLEKYRTVGYNTVMTSASLRTGLICVRRSARALAFVADSIYRYTLLQYVKLTFKKRKLP